MSKPRKKLSRATKPRSTSAGASGCDDAVTAAAEQTDPSVPGSTPERYGWPLTAAPVSSYLDAWVPRGYVESTCSEARVRLVGGPGRNAPRGAVGAEALL